MNSLQERFKIDQIYTYCGSTLISVNPDDHFDGEYGLEKKEEYAKSLDNEYFLMKTLQPHLYSLAVGALHELRYDETPASKIAICLGGGSGSGKTEAGRYLLDFVTYCHKKEFDTHSLESKVPIMHREYLLQVLTSDRLLMVTRSSQPSETPELTPTIILRGSESSSTCLLTPRRTRSRTTRPRPFCLIRTEWSIICMGIGTSTSSTPS